MRELNAIQAHLANQCGLRVEFSDDSLTGIPNVFQAKSGIPVVLTDLPQDQQDMVRLWGLLLQYMNGNITKDEFDAAGAVALRKSFKKRDKPITASHALGLVRKLMPDMQLRTSRRGVPHLVLGDKSVAWFTSLQTYRVFEGYGDFSKSQKRFDYKTPDEVRAHLQDEMGYCLTIDRKTGVGSVHMQPMPKLSGGLHYTAVTR